MSYLIYEVLKSHALEARDWRLTARLASVDTRSHHELRPWLRGAAREALRAAAPGPEHTRHVKSILPCIARLVRVADAWPDLHVSCLKSGADPLSLAAILTCVISARGSAADWTRIADVLGRSHFGTSPCAADELVSVEAAESILDAFPALMRDLEWTLRGVGIPVIRRFHGALAPERLLQAARLVVAEGANMDAWLYATNRGPGDVTRQRLSAMFGFLEKVYFAILHDAEGLRWRVLHDMRCPRGPREARNMTALDAARVLGGLSGGLWILEAHARDFERVDCMADLQSARLERVRVALADAMSVMSGEYAVPMPRAHAILVSVFAVLFRRLGYYTTTAIVDCLPELLQGSLLVAERERVIRAVQDVLFRPLARADFTAVVGFARAVAARRAHLAGFAAFSRGVALAMAVASWALLGGAGLQVALIFSSGAAATRVVVGALMAIMGACASGVQVEAVREAHRASTLVAMSTDFGATGRALDAFTVALLEARVSATRFLVAARRAVGRMDTDPAFSDMRVKKISLKA